MFTNMYIYVLEVVTALLVVATVVQVYRCSKSFYNTAQVSKVPSSVTAPATHPDIIEKTYSSSGDILHDYIGEFFLESDSAAGIQLKQYQVSEPTKVIPVKSVPLITTAIIQESGVKERRDDIESVSNVLSFDEPSEGLEKKVIVEDDDDTVITVMNSSEAPSGSNGGNVMSDKVVHAMLDEAKLVCVS